MIRFTQRLAQRVAQAAAVAALAVVSLASAPAQAQVVIAEYYAYLGGPDLTNSSGTRLTTLGAIVQQDRANYHRFRVRQELDDPDPIFSSSDMRARIPGLVAAGDPVEPRIVDNILSGRGHWVYIRVLGRNGQATHINIYEGAG